MKSAIVSFCLVLGIQSAEASTQYARRRCVSRNDGWPDAPPILVVVASYIYTYTYTYIHTRMSGHETRRVIVMSACEDATANATAHRRDLRLIVRVRLYLYLYLYQRQHLPASPSKDGRFSTKICKISFLRSHVDDGSTAPCHSRRAVQLVKIVFRESRANPLPTRNPFPSFSLSSRPSPLSLAPTVPSPPPPAISPVAFSPSIPLSHFSKYSPIVLRALSFKLPYDCASVCACRVCPYLRPPLLGEKYLVFAPDPAPPSIRKIPLFFLIATRKSRRWDRAEIGTPSRLVTYSIIIFVSLVEYFWTILRTYLNALRIFYSSRCQFSRFYPAEFGSIAA